MERVLVVWCPDWAVVASGRPLDGVVAVVAANRIVAASGSAQAVGVGRGLRRREAQARCPSLELVPADPARDARAFEPVVAAVERFAPRVEIVRPGVVTLGTRGPSRYFGGDRALAEQVAGAVAGVVASIAPGASAVSVGVADGRFAAEQAARVAGAGWVAEVVGLVDPDSESGARGHVHVVAPGRSAPFLAPLPITVLPFEELAGRLGRLGLSTLGDLAALPGSAVQARFGAEGAEAHRLASGWDARPVTPRVAPPDLAVEAERVDTVAFVAKGLADRLHAGLTEAGLMCTRVSIEAETEHGERLARLWRHDGALSPGAIAERVRWQLDGWLAGREPAAGFSGITGDRRADPSGGAPVGGLPIGGGASGGGTSGGLTRLRLVPDEVGPDRGRQMDFWGGAGEDERMARTLARLQGMLGPDEVVTAVVGGGRSPEEQVRLVPWGDRREPSRSGSPIEETRAGPFRGPAAGRFSPGALSSRAPRGSRARTAVEIPPWPGRLPGPAPATVHVPPLRAAVRDAAGCIVGVTGRGEPSAPPVGLSIADGPWREITAWAGPWPVEDRWWDLTVSRRVARFQVVVADGNAYLLGRQEGGWWVTATYD